jgi:hypothetical protein
LRINEKHKGIDKWFAKTINEIAGLEARGSRVRILGARILTEWFGKAVPESVPRRLLRGEHAAVVQKQLWMILMFLRRDQGIVRCLFERALKCCEDGEHALKQWFDDECFSPQGSELPVDGRMMKIGRLLFHGDVVNELSVFQSAFEWGESHGIPPSTLDALFFAES